MGKKRQPNIAYGSHSQYASVLTNKQLERELTATKKRVAKLEDQLATAQHTEANFRNYCRVFASGMPISSEIIDALSEWQDQVRAPLPELVLTTENGKLSDAQIARTWKMPF